jgi:hypothetical protein
MRSPDEQLDRLLRGAARTPHQGDGDAPYGFSARVVARWQNSPDAELGWDIAAWLTRAAVGAMAVMVLAAVIHFSVPATPVLGSEMEIANAAFQEGLWP